MYQLIIPGSVEKDLDDLPRSVRDLIVNEYLPSIQSDPTCGKLLHGPFRRFRAFAFSSQGVDYRVVYEVVKNSMNIVLIMVGARGDFCKRLRGRK